MSAAERGRTAMVVSHVTPVLGLERCVLRLVEELGDGVDLVCIGEDRTALAALGLTGEVLGRPVRGVRRLASLRRLWRWTRTDRHEVLLVAGAWAALPLLLVAPRGRRIVVWEHSFSDEKINSSGTLKLLALLARVLYRRADRVVCVSEDLARQLGRRIGAIDPVVIANHLGRQTAGTGEVARPLFPPGVRRLLTVGSLSRTKNQRLVIEALAHLEPDVVLVIVGDGPERAELERRTRESGAAERVMFLGHVSDPSPWFRWCEVVVQPALGETFGLAMFEAAEYRRPVVSLDYGVARDIIGSAVPGALAPADPVGLADAIRHVLRTPPGPDDFDRADDERGRRYASDAITGRWNDVLQPEVPAIGGRG